MRSARTLLLCVLLLAGPTGCITWFTDPMGYRAAFDRMQRQYTNCVRWGQVERASRFVDPTQRETYLKQAPAFESLRVTDFEIGEVDYVNDRATVTVTYSGYSLDTFVERKIHENQEWYREENSLDWRVRSDIAVFAKSFEGAQR